MHHETFKRVHTGTYKCLILLVRFTENYIGINLHSWDIIISSAYSFTVHIFSAHVNWHFYFLPTPCYYHINNDFSVIRTWFTRDIKKVEIWSNGENN